MRSSLLAYAKLRYIFRTYKFFSQKHNVHPANSYKDENFRKKILDFVLFFKSKESTKKFCWGSQNLYCTFMLTAWRLTSASLQNASNISCQSTLTFHFRPNCLPTDRQPYTGTPVASRLGDFLV